MNARQTTIPLSCVEVARFDRLGRVWARWSSHDTLVSLVLGDLDARAPTLPTDALVMRDVLREAISAYLAGAAHPFEAVALAPASSAFAEQVRRAMIEIPRGHTRTYGQIAADMGRARAARAVGRCCGANPIPLIVPCHRVVSASELGGFSLGRDAKRTLLDIEAFASSLRWR